MYIDIPFLDDYALDTKSAQPVTDGPGSAEMEEVILSLEDGEVLVRFAAPGTTFEVRVEEARPHPTLPETWWLMGTLANDPREMEVYILWRPGSTYNNYLTHLIDVIDTRGWGRTRESYASLRR